MWSAARYSAAAVVARLMIVAVRLVDRDHVGELDQPLLDALQLVAGARQHQGEEEVGHVGDRGLRLPGADRLHQDHVEARRLAKQHGLAGLGGDAAERAGGGRGADEGVGVGGEPRHPGLVAEDRAAGAGGGGIDREHGDAVPALGEPGPQRVDGGRLADPRRAGDADAHGLAGVGQQLLHQLPRLALMIRPLRFDERDRPRQHRALAATDAAREAGNVEGRANRRGVRSHGLRQIKRPGRRGSSSRGSVVG